ncbi:MAG: hypothetical protein IKQ22_01430 [Clostridia bacterium]|nr:hypothetical protein [Clostridia bacterium]
MRKTIAVMLVLLLMVSLAGCMYDKEENGASEKTSDNGKEKASMTRRGTVTSVSDDTITLTIGTSSDKSKQKSNKKDHNEETPEQGEDGKIPTPPSGKPEGIPENPPGASGQESAPPVGQTEPPALPPSQESGQLTPPTPPDAEQEADPGADEKTQKEGPGNSSTGTKKEIAGKNTSNNTNKDKKDPKSEQGTDKSKKSTVKVNISEVSVFDRDGQKISPAELRPGDAVVIGYDDDGTIISISLTDASSSDKKEPKKQNDESSGSSKKVPKAPSLNDSDSIFDPEQTEKAGG